jgi:hypothetical protein
MAISMGRIDLILSDELEQELRIEAGRRFGARRGSLTKAVEEAIRLWIKMGKEADQNVSHS